MPPATLPDQTPVTLQFHLSYPQSSGRLDTIAAESKQRKRSGTSVRAPTRSSFQNQLPVQFVTSGTNPILEFVVSTHVPSIVLTEMTSERPPVNVYKFKPTLLCIVVTQYQNRYLAKNR